MTPATTTTPILCPVCQSGPLDPPKACEFCPESVVASLDEIEAVLARLAALAREVDHVVPAATQPATPAI